MNLRDFLRVGTKLKESVLRTTTKSILLLQPEKWFCQQNGPKRRQLQDCIWMKKWCWYLSVWIVDVVLQGVWVLYRFNKDEGDKSLPLLAFRRDVVNTIFVKYSKKGRLSSSHIGIRNIPSDVCYDGAKHYQAQSSDRRTQNTFKHLRWSVFA